MRKCKDCGLSAKTEEILNLFVKNKKCLYGRKNICKQCHNIRSLANNAKPEVRKRTRSSQLKNRYGITYEEFEKMFSAQEGRCKICNKQKEIVVDHNHNTDEVRGLLCHNCNRGIGFLMDSPAIIKNAYEYLMESSFYGDTQIERKI